MTDYKYHDLKRIEHILEYGFTDKYVFSDMKLLALYYRDYLGYKPAKREEMLYDFCKKHIANYSEVTYYKMIDRALNYAKKKDKKIIEVDHVNIYKYEIDFIDNLPLEVDIKKILFTLLVKIKLNKIAAKMLSGANYEGFYTSKNLKDSEVVKAANLDKKKKQIEYFFLLESEGYITTYYTGAMKINIFYDMEEVEDDEIVIAIDDYSNIGYYYDYLHGRNHIKLCEVCSAPFKSKSNNAKYCEEHRTKVVKNRKVICIDCGEEFEVNPRNVMTIRCGSCQSKRNKELNREASRERMRKYRERLHLD